MNQNKGFTLIELLAVIVILAIIALIAVPVIMNIIDKANKSAFKDSAYGIINAGELYFAEMQLEPLGMLEDVTITLPDTTKTLELKGEVPTGKILITKEGKIALAVSNGRYCITKSIDDIDVKITEDYESCELPSGGNDAGGNQETDREPESDSSVSFSSSFSLDYYGLTGKTSYRNIVYMPRSSYPDDSFYSQCVRVRMYYPLKETDAFYGEYLYHGADFYGYLHSAPGGAYNSTTGSNHNPYTTLTLSDSYLAVLLESSYYSDDFTANSNYPYLSTFKFTDLGYYVGDSYSDCLNQLSNYAFGFDGSK